MALLDRVKERIETDLSDTELQAMIDAVTADIEQLYGVNGQITAHREGDGKFLSLTRPMDGSQAATVTEISPRGLGTADAMTELTADDYRILHGGRTLERLVGGTNGATRWAPLVEVTYTPVSDAAKREEVVIKMVALDLTYRGLDKQESVGDYSRSGSVTSDAYTRERDALLQQLAPRPGLMMA